MVQFPSPFFDLLLRGAKIFYVTENWTIIFKHKKNFKYRKDWINTVMCIWQDFHVHVISIFKEKEVNMTSMLTVTFFTKIIPFFFMTTFIVKKWHGSLPVQDLWSNCQSISFLDKKVNVKHTLWPVKWFIFYPLFLELFYLYMHVHG